MGKGYINIMILTMDDPLKLLVMCWALAVSGRLKVWMEVGG